MADLETSLSESYANLFKSSKDETSGFEILNRPIARGTVRLMIGSPYYKRWFMVRRDISWPISSPKAINATPITAEI